MVSITSSNRLRRPADPKFTRLVELMREGQLAGAIQIRIERPKDGAESSVLIFGPSKDPQLAARGRELKSILGIKPDLRELKVNYGGYSGRDDEIDMMTRSMLQIMLEFAAIVRVLELDVVQGKATPGLVDAQAAGALSGPPLRVLVTDMPPQDAYVAVQYNGRWFWIADTDIQSGIHRCAGNRLAEMQLTILWEEILKRFPPIEVVEKPKRAYSNLIHGITEMKVRIPA